MTQGTQNTKTFRIGIITGSQRTPRAGDQITSFVFQVIESYLANHASSSSTPCTFTFDHIDIAALNLPFFNEPGIPSRIKSADEYAHEHTREWSRRVSALDGFVFVTPQYNWGIPAGLKNAIDYLFNEWVGKPAVIVSYGGHGGDKAAGALKLVLAGGVDMQVGEHMVVNLTFPNREFLVKAARGLDLGLDAEKEGSPWSKDKKEIEKAWDEMVGMLVSKEFANAAV